jgi:L-threonylcarbamoyladenylate synthase
MVDPRLLERAACLIREGRLVAFPTETVYGLGANALDPVAVARIFALKERPAFDPLIVHVGDSVEVERLAWADDPRVHRLMEAFWPGPLTLVLQRREVIPDLVTAGLPTVGVRMPAHPVALSLIREAGCPIAAPSANKFGRVSPTRAEHVRRQLPGVDLVLDGGQTPVGLESTIVSLDDQGFLILRPGVITRDALERHVPRSPRRLPPETASAPGMLKSHYSPSKPLYLHGTEPPSLPRARGGFLRAAGDAPEGYGCVVDISPRGDLLEAAAGLFSALHELEEADVDYIVADPVEDAGVGAAIMDRLRKAAWRFRTQGASASRESDEG